MNPIVQMINRAGNIGQAMQMYKDLKNGNADAVFQQMINTNPQFKKFVEDNKGKSADQICKENGIDASILSKFR